MRNDLTIYDEVAERWWSDDIRWVRTLKNLVPGRLAWFDRQIDWQGKAVLPGCRAATLRKSCFITRSRVSPGDSASTVRARC